MISYPLKKSDLASLYFPELAPHQACNRLRRCEGCEVSEGCFVNFPGIQINNGVSLKRGRYLFIFPHSLQTGGKILHILHSGRWSAPVFFLLLRFGQDGGDLVGSPLCVDAVYAQAKALLDSGFRYWFQGEEIDELNRRNRRFETPNPARELILFSSSCGSGKMVVISSVVRSATSQKFPLRVCKFSKPSSFMMRPTCPVVSRMLLPKRATIWLAVM